MTQQKTFSRVHLVALLLVAFAVALWLFLPPLSRARDTPRWAYCASNLKGIGEAMYIYAQDGDVFPMHSGVNTTNTGRMRLFFPTDRGPFQPRATGTPSPTVDLWMLMRANNSTPKQWICTYTPDQPDPARDTSAYYDFLTAAHLSYAYQYQHDPDFPPLGTTSDPLLPVMADGNPCIKGAVTAPPAQDRVGPGAGNSLNHGNREHQNVLFVDGRVKKVDSPAQGLVGPIDQNVLVGTSGADNIYTTHDGRGRVDPGLAPTATSCNVVDGRDSCLVP